MAVPFLSGSCLALTALRQNLWKAMTLFAVITLLLIWVLTWPASATDWDGCQEDLERLQWAARDAAYAAEEVQTKEEELEEHKEEFEECASFPETFDLLDDNCESARDEYESAKSDYESAKSDLELELESVSSAVRSVALSCDFTLSSPATGGISIPAPPSQTQSFSPRTPTGSATTDSPSPNDPFDPRKRPGRKKVPGGWVQEIEPKVEQPAPPIPAKGD